MQSVGGLKRYAVTELDLVTKKCTFHVFANLCDIYFIVLFKDPHTLKGQL